MVRKRLIIALLIVVLALPALVFAPLAGAQGEATGVARVRIGYFAFDPKDFDTYADGELFPFATQLVNVGWSVDCFSIRCNTASPFFDFPDGMHSFAFAPQGKGLEAAILGPKEVSLGAGHAYSLAIVGSLDAGNLDLLVIDDTQILGETDPKTAFVGILVNNIAGISAFEIVMGENKELVRYGQFAGRLYPAGRGVFFDVYAASGDQRGLLFPMSSVPLPARVSDFGALFGLYSGVYGKDYFYTSNWGYLGEITVLDGGAIEVGSEATGEIAAVTQRVRYTLTLTADTVVNITASGTGRRNYDTILLNVTTFDPAVYVFDAEGKLLVWSDDVSLTDFSAKLEGIALKAGTYRIEVGGSYDLVSGPFKLIIESAVSE